MDYRMKRTLTVRKLQKRHDYETRKGCLSYTSVREFNLLRVRLKMRVAVIVDSRAAAMNSEKRN